VRTKQWVTTLATVALLSACGPAPAPAPAPAPFSPAGTYAVTVDADGQQTIEATMLITGGADAYTGSISSDMGDFVMADIVVTGNAITFSIHEFGVNFSLNFDGDSFVGEMTGAMGAGSIVGVKTSGS